MSKIQLSDYKLQLEVARHSNTSIKLGYVSFANKAHKTKYIKLSAI